MYCFFQTLLKFTDLFIVCIWGRILDCWCNTGVLFACILDCWCNTGVLFACEFTYLFQPLYHEAHIFLAMESVHETRQRQVEIVHTSNKYKTDIYIIMLQLVHAWKFSTRFEALYLGQITNGSLLLNEEAKENAQQVCLWICLPGNVSTILKLWSAIRTRL